jgi:hypothetical protein
MDRTVARGPRTNREDRPLVRSQGDIGGGHRRAAAEAVEAGSLVVLELEQPEQPARKETSD